ncbi:hypothetical protein [Arthrobacter sp. KBS0703]|nr:hypothetical protein [Arthrobacter sp. KBS0703]
MTTTQLPSRRPDATASAAASARRASLAAGAPATCANSSAAGA